MSKSKKITTREKVHNGVDSIIDFVLNTKEKTSSVAGKAIDAVKKGGNFVADKTSEVIKPIKLRIELEKEAKVLGYGAIKNTLANKIKKGIALTAEESMVYKRLSNENL